MKKNAAFAVALTSFALVSAACAHDKDKIEYQGAMKSIPHATIGFKAGSSMLDDGDKATLRRLVQNARSNGDIDQVTVAAWSDQALPREGHKLSDADRDLADNRNKAIRDFLKKEMDVGDVDTYSMAEPSNWLARTFNTKEAELKSIFSRRTSNNPVTHAEFQMIRNEGGPGNAVVVVEREYKDDDHNYNK